jgi:hypothetical protein
VIAGSNPVLLAYFSLPKTRSLAFHKPFSLVLKWLCLDLFFISPAVRATRMPTCLLLWLAFNTIRNMSTEENNKTKWSEIFFHKACKHIINSRHRSLDIAVLTRQSTNKPPPESQVTYMCSDGGGRMQSSPTVPISLAPRALNTCDRKMATGTEVIVMLTSSFDSPMSKMQSLKCKRKNECQRFKLTNSRGWAPPNTESLQRIRQ